MDRLDAMQMFVRVVETGSFTRVAHEFTTTQPTVTKQIAAMEARLKVRLFHRSTRSVSLTAEGVLFLERSRRILAEIEAAELELSQASSAPRGRLRVSLPLVSSLLLPVLGEFMRDYPAIELDLDFTDRLVDVIEEGFDAVVRTGDPVDSRLSARRLGAFGSMLVAAPDYLARRGTPNTPADLLQHTCLHYRFPNSGKLEPWALRRAPSEPELPLPTSMICNNIETRVCFALQGLGIAYLPDFSIREPLADGRLRAILTDHVQRTGVFHVLWPASKHPSPKVRAFVDFLSAKVFPPSEGKQPGWPQVTTPHAL